MQPAGCPSQLLINRWARLKLCQLGQGLWSSIMCLDLLCTCVMLAVIIQQAQNNSVCVIWMWCPCCTQNLHRFQAGLYANLALGCVSMHVSLTTRVQNSIVYAQIPMHVAWQLIVSCLQHCECANQTVHISCLEDLSDSQQTVTGKATYSKH